MIKTTFSTSSNIIFNGKKIEKITDLPESVQKLIEDKDNNGMPDFADNIVNNIKDENENNIEIIDTVDNPIKVIKVKNTQLIKDKITPNIQTENKERPVLGTVHSSNNSALFIILLILIAVFVIYILFVE